MNEYDQCPHCGQKILKGAMKCTACGRILKTPEEKMEAIKNVMESGKRTGRGGFLKTVIIVCVLGFLAYYFKDEIMRFIQNILKQ